MSIRDKYNRISNIRNTSQDGVIRSRKFAKNRLTRAIEKKFKTCFIGAVDSVEHHFGLLWGKDQTSEKTPFQQKMVVRWQSLRTEILDKGNTQLRAMLKELEEYNVDWEGYKTDIELRDN